jgi:hypothetical protein
MNRLSGVPDDIPFPLCPTCKADFVIRLACWICGPHPDYLAGPRLVNADAPDPVEACTRCGARWNTDTGEVLRGGESVKSRLRRRQRAVATKLSRYVDGRVRSIIHELAEKRPAGWSRQAAPELAALETALGRAAAVAARGGSKRAFEQACINYRVAHLRSFARAPRRSAG